MEVWPKISFPKRCKPLPPGFRVAQLDSGHFLWVREGEGFEYEGFISWDRWWVRRCAFAHYESLPLIGLATCLLLEAHAKQKRQE